jgi:DNA-binding response OmpR family regulator
MKALVVDDEAAVRRLLGRVLAERGWTVTAAANGPEALGIPIDAQFELAFLDVDLGEKSDGIALARKLRELRPLLRIVMMSGDPDNAARVSGAGLGETLAKPFELSVIARLLESGAQI